jgi:hypothetical protein
VPRKLRRKPSRSIASFQDIVILESDLALGLTSKVMHNYLRYSLVKFGNFCTSPVEVMLSLVHCPESVY